MKKMLSAAVLLSALAAQAWAGGPRANPGNGQGNPPVTNPGKDITVTIPGPSNGVPNSNSPVHMVPEPESIALVVAGLAVVGVAAWRRRK
ncbi:MAG: PEP-CTERM sorting domain-containing protein [Aquabacterium sp.]